MRDDSSPVSGYDQEWDSRVLERLLLLEIIEPQDIIGSTVTSEYELTTRLEPSPTKSDDVHLAWLEQR